MDALFNDGTGTLDALYERLRDQQRAEILRILAIRAEPWTTNTMRDMDSWRLIDLIPGFRASLSDSESDSGSDDRLPPPLLSESEDDGPQLHTVAQRDAEFIRAQAASLAQAYLNEHSRIHEDDYIAPADYVAPADMPAPEPTPAPDASANIVRWRGIAGDPVALLRQMTEW